MTIAGPKTAKGKKPQGNLDGINVAQGLEKEPQIKAEVLGHTSVGIRYVCWRCEALNYVSLGSNYFYCHNCSALNVV